MRPAITVIQKGGENSMELRAWASAPDWDCVYTAHTQPLWPIRASSLKGRQLKVEQPSGPIIYRRAYWGRHIQANFRQLSPRPSTHGFAWFRSLPFGRDAIRNVHMCLCYHLYLYMYMYIVRTGGRPARNLHIKYVAQLRAGENHSDAVCVHISKIESWHFTIHFLFRSTRLWKMIGENTSTHVVT